MSNVNVSLLVSFMEWNEVR